MRHKSLLVVIAILIACAAVAVPTRQAAAGTYQQPPFFAMATIPAGGEATAQWGYAVFKNGTTCVVAAMCAGPYTYLYIVDRRGKVVAQDVRDNAYKIATWKPSYTGTFGIRVVNAHPGDSDVIVWSN